MDRYHLLAPTFCREKDVEQFIAEFSDVAAICRCHSDIAAVMSDKNSQTLRYQLSIFEALRDWFGLKMHVYSYKT